MLKRVSLALAVMLFISANVFAGTVEEAGLDWYDNLDEAIEAAQEADSLIYIYFTGGTRCGWCVRMKNETFSNEEVQEQVLSNFVLVMLNVWEGENKEANAALQRSYGGRGVPFNVVLNKDGDLVSKFGGYKAPADFIETMDDILDKYETITELRELICTEEGHTYENLLTYARTCESLSLTDEAGEAAAAALALDEDNEEGNNAELCWLQLQTAEGEEAEELAEMMCGYDEGNENGYIEKYYLMRIEKSGRDWNAALGFFEELMAQELELHEAQKVYYYGGVIYLNKRQNDSAREWFQRCVDEDPSSRMGQQAAQIIQQRLGG